MSVCVFVPAQKPTFKCPGHLWLKGVSVILAFIKKTKLGEGFLALGSTADNENISRGRSRAVAVDGPQ